MEKLKYGIGVLSLILCLIGCSYNSEQLSDETVSSDELKSEADTTENVEESFETEPATSPIISCDDFPVDLLSKETIGDYNIYTFGVDNFHYYSGGVAFFYADDTKEEDIAYVLDNGKLIRMDEEVIKCGVFWDEKLWEEGDEVNSLLEKYGFEEDVLEDFIISKFISQNSCFYKNKEPFLKYGYVKAIDDDRLLICTGAGWRESFFEYSLSTGAVTELFEGLEEWCHGIHMASFSEDMTSAVIGVQENSYDSGYYYVDLVNNTYTNIEEHFGIELNWFKEEALDAADTDFMWGKDNTYLIMSQSDEVYTLYKCDFAADTIEILGENLLKATTVTDTTYKSRKAILTIDSDGELVIQDPSQGVSATLDRKITDTFGYGLLDENDGIIYTMNDIAMIVDWDNDSITEIDAGKLEGWKSVRIGNDIYVFEDNEDLEQDSAKKYRQYILQIISIYQAVFLKL